ncbi:MAG: carboxymuconolactone decarboxylase family protein [Dongiaceae bacterium]
MEAGTMTRRRFPPLTMDAMTPEQRTVADCAVSGPKQRLGDSLNLWLRSPGVAAPVHQLGEYARYSNTLSNRLKELAICLVTRHWQTQSTWDMHYAVAVREGIDAAALDRIAAGDEPADLSGDDRIVYDFVVSLLAGGSMADSVFGAARRRFGEAVMVDLIGLVGYYCLVCLNKNVDIVPVADAGP